MRGRVVEARQLLMYTFFLATSRGEFRAWMSGWLGSLWLLGLIEPHA